MIVRLLTASLRRRGRQLVLMALAVMVAAAAVAALAGFAHRAREGGLAAELAAFGPNLVVRPQVGGPATLPVAELATVRGLSGVETARGVADRAAAPAARSTEGSAAPLGGAGSAPAGLARIEVRAARQRLDEVAAAIEATVPGAEARPLRRVSAAESDLVRRLTLVLAATSLVTVLLALVSVGAATTALLEERRTEVGLLLALGSSGLRVGAIFAAELLTAAVAAGLAGEVLGELAAGRLAGDVLGTPAGFDGPSLAWAAAPAVALAVVGLAMTLSLVRVGSIDPARVLRGE